jgi:hypothetical protein
MKKRTIILIIAMLVSVMSIGQVSTLKGFYLGCDTNMNIYSFEDQDDNYVDFYSVSSQVLKSFDLRSESLVGAAFLITYTVKGVGSKDSDDYYDVMNITKLESITLKKNIEVEDE